MNRFRDDPKWQEFWTNRQRHEKVCMYSFAPFFESAAILVRGARALLPQYRRRHAGELLALAQEFEDRARHLRGNGIGWMANMTPGFSPLTSAIHKRSHFGVEEPRIRTREIAEYVLVLTSDLLFLFEDMFIRIEKEAHHEANTAVWFFGKLETLTDMCEQRTSHAFPGATLRMLGLYALLLECEGLAYAQAMIEDGFRRKRGSMKKKKCPTDDEALQKLAEELRVSPEVLKDIFEKEYSGWWDIKEAYAAQALALRDTFIATLALPEAIKEAISVAWNSGSTSLVTEGYPHCFGEDEFAESEKTTKLLIAMFLSFPGFDDGKGMLREAIAQQENIPRVSR